MALSATARLPRMLALCRADGSVVLPLSRQATSTGSNGRGADVDARAVLMQVTGADGSAAIRTGVQGERVRSLGHCGVITRALSAWTPAQRSRTDCLPASWSRCVGAERTVARLVHWHPTFSVWMDAGGAAVVCTSSGNHWAAV